MLVGQQGMGKSGVMMMNAGNADSGSRNDAAVLARSGLLDRRSFLFGSAISVGALSLAGCVTQDGMSVAEAAKLYGPVPEEKFPIPAVDIAKVDPKYYRRTVRYDTKEAPGTIIVDPGNYYVYRIEGDGSATRYGANVGRDGFRWNGDAYVGRKSEWATWTPPREMIKRQPEAAKWAGGMPGGLDNGIDRLRRCRSPQPGHDPPLLANSGQDEGGGPARIGKSVSLASETLVWASTGFPLPSRQPHPLNGRE